MQAPGFILPKRQGRAEAFLLQEMDDLVAYTAGLARDG